MTCYSRGMDKRTLAKKFEAARRAYNDAMASEMPERRLCLRDRRFAVVPGAQWEDEFSQNFENRPRFEVNLCQIAVMRVVNSYRANRIDAVFTPADPASAQEATDFVTGLHRADEQRSGAQNIYDAAFADSTAGGMGAWRLCGEYEDDEDIDEDKQRIRFEPIPDADVRVFLDPSRKHFDGRGAAWGLVLVPFSAEAFATEFPNASPSTWGAPQGGFDWVDSAGVVWCAEYYERETRTRTAEVWRLDVDALDEPLEERIFKDDDGFEETVRELQAMGYRLVRTRKIKSSVVHKYVFSGEPLEYCGPVPGTEIPIVICYGKRWFVDGRERCQGVVRTAHDSQRLKNAQTSLLAEVAISSPVEKPVFTPEQVARHAPMWSEDRVKNYPFLLVDALRNDDGTIASVGPVAYTKPPTVPPALATLLQVSSQDLVDVLGGQQAGEEIRSGVSGETMKRIQARLDQQSFIYVDNFAAAKRRSAEIWLGMARELYDEDGRPMSTIDSEGAGALKRIGDVVPNPLGGKTTELRVSKFDVSYKVGPSTQTAREAAVDAVIQVLPMAADPADQSVLLGVLMSNLESENMSGAQKYFRRKLIAVGAATPTETEKKEKAEADAAAGAQTDPNADFLMAEAEKSKSATVLNLAKAEKTSRETELL